MEQFCPECESENVEWDGVELESGWNIWICKDCGEVYLSPPESKEDE